MTEEEALSTIHSLTMQCNDVVASAHAELVKNTKVVLDEWAKTNARFKKGDIIQRKHIKLRVEDIAYGRYAGGGLYVKYIGTLLTGEPDRYYSIRDDIDFVFKVGESPT